jgi:transcriptional regulator with XRE-family HTH domain
MQSLVDPNAEPNPRKHIRAYRALNDFPLRKLSQLSGLSVSKLHRIESGKWDMTPDELALLGALLGAPEEILMR